MIASATISLTAGSSSTMRIRAVCIFLSYEGLVRDVALIEIPMGFDRKLTESLATIAITGK